MLLGVDERSSGEETVLGSSRRACRPCPLRVNLTSPSHPFPPPTTLPTALQPATSCSTPTSSGAPARSAASSSRSGRSSSSPTAAGERRRGERREGGGAAARHRNTHDASHTQHNTSNETNTTTTHVRTKLSLPQVHDLGQQDLVARLGVLCRQQAHVGRAAVGHQVQGRPHRVRALPAGGHGG